MFYLTIDSTHFMVMAVVKDHSANEKGYPLMQLHGLLFLIRSNFLFYLTVHTIDRIVYTMAFAILVVEKWLNMKNFSGTTMRN